MSESVDMLATLGEDVVYEPYNGTAKTIKAVVERRPSRVDAVGGVQYPVNVIEVWVAMDAVSGVLTVREGLDHIQFKRRLFDPDVTNFKVHKMLNHDSGLGVGTGGMFHLEVQA